MNDESAKMVTLLLLLNKAMGQLTAQQRQEVKVTQHEVEMAVRTKEFPTRIHCTVNPEDPLAPKVYKAVFSNNEIRKQTTRVFDLWGS